MLAVPAVFGGLVLATGVRRQWRQCRDTMVAALAGGALLLAVFVGVTGRNRNDVLRVFWQDYYPSAQDLPGYLVRRYDEHIALMGFVPTTLLVLLVVGVVFLFLHRNVAVGAAVLAVPVIAIGLGVARLYPLLDLRTSHFLLVTVQAVAGIGVGALVVGAARLVREVLDGARFARPASAVVAAVLAVVALAGYAGNNRVWYRFDGSEPGFAQFTQPAVENTRAATSYVRAHIGPDDVLVLSGRARMSFAFYWADVPLVWQPYPNAIGWIPELTGPARDAESLGQTTDTIQGPIDRALAQAQRNGPEGKVWLIRSPWDSSPEVWQSALSAYDVQAVTGIAVMIITNKKSTVRP
jgi:hypothetical protein